MGLYEWRLHILVAIVAVVLVLKIFLPMLLYLVFAILSVLCGAALAILQGRYKRRRKKTYPRPPEPKTEGLLARVKVYPPPSAKPILLSSNVDAHIQTVIELTLKCHVVPTYEKVGRDQGAFFGSVVPEVWSALAILLKHVGKIDTMKLITQDVVEALRVHFECFRGMHFQSPQVPQHPPKFPNLELFPYLESENREVNFLRQAAEVLLCVCLSKDLLGCPPIRVIVREYLACHILQPTIEMICDPDYINQKLLAYLIRREQAMKSAEKKYVYNTYEDFAKHINKCEDIMELQQIREFIITDIIQAKAVQKMKTSRASRLHGGQFPIPIQANKVKTLMERDLEVYITQLGTLKTLCERKIRKWGGEDYNSSSTETVTEPQQSDMPPGIPFETIMWNDIARGHFCTFLEHCGFDHLLKFWIAVEDFKSGSQGASHKNVKSIYDLFLSSSAVDPIYPNPSLVEPIEKYLGGKIVSCTDSLNAMQQSIYEELLDQFYDSFIRSEDYRKLMRSENYRGEGAEGSVPPLAQLSEASRSDSPSLDDSRYKQKLKNLKLKLDEKVEELSIIPEHVRSGSLAMRKKSLQKDRSLLEEEIKKLEHYIDHTEEWFDTVGKWSVEIHSVDVSREESHDEDPLFVIVVHRPNPTLSRIAESQSSLSSLDSLQGQQEGEEGQSSTGSCEDETTDDYFEEVDSAYQSRAGWVVGRRLSEFQQMHSKVVEICPNLQFPPLPTWFNPFQRPDAQSKYWQKYRAALQSYTLTVLQDDRLQESEEVFNFLSPASEHLRKSSSFSPEKKRHTFPLAVPGMGIIFSKDHKDHEDDSIADHMYLLVSEVFELDAWSRVLRKQLMELVQLTFGKSIDRELQEFTNWVVSEPMLIFYLETFQNAMWPDGKPAPPVPTRSDEEKAHTKEEARKRFLKIAPQALQTVLGQRNCQIGYQKIFNALQDPRANKQLFYSLFEILLYALVPELENVEIEESPLD